MALLALFILCGIGAFFIFGLPLLHKIGGKSAGLFMPSDANIRIDPEYSVAEARVNEGKYQEAVDEYRKVVVEHPTDIYPHLRVADLMLKHFNDAKTAELELLSAFTKANGEYTTTLAAGRLADLYQLTLHEPARALEVMKQLREKIPGTKQAKLAEERIATLEGIVLRAEPLPESPGKIAARPSRFKLTE
jgi:outer membrane protein assembly factor BamD (BamD/ComL family)